MEHNFNTIQERISLVKEDMLNRYPGCHYTVVVTLWDDETSMVECKHCEFMEGDKLKICVSMYYDEKLSYYDFDITKGNASMIVDGEGYKYYRCNKEPQFPKDQLIEEGFILSKWVKKLFKIKK